jgi:hypothetical protein
VRTGQFGGGFLLFFEKLFESPDGVRIKDVFDPIGVPVDMTGGDVRVVYKVQFPQTVVTHDSRGLLLAGRGKPNALTGVLDESLSGSAVEQTPQADWGP